MAPIEELALLEFDRSNKGASKQRRDQINAEIATMRDLLPLPESSRQRLSQLQIMSLTCVYIRKCNVLQKIFRSRPQESQLPDALDFFQAMTGFLLVTTREGKLLYISENVTDYLGHSMVDMKTQGDSLYDIVDKRDHGTVQAQLLHGGPMQDSDPGTDVSLFCRMNMSRTLKRQSGFGDVKVMHVRGHFLQMSSTEPGCPSDSQCVFMATCTPLITPDMKENLVQNNTMVFKSVHKLDMTYLEITRNGEYHLGYSSEYMSQKSWYSMLHPEDIHEAKEKHMQLIRSNHEIGCMLTVRMLRMDGSSFWVNTVMHVRQASLSQNEEPLIVCINQVIDAREAYQIKVQGHMFSMYPSRPHELWGSHLPAVPSPNQDHMGGQWMQQSSTSSVPVPSYPANIPNYISHPGRPDMFPTTCSSMVAPSRASKPTVGYPNSLIQLDQLKAMLKRKIQGPQSSSCKPVKLPKVNWDIDGTSGGPGYPEMDQGLTHVDHYGQAPGASHINYQNQMVQVLQPNVYRIGMMTASKMSLKQLTFQGQSKMGSMIAEQVVPDLNVPESYLTPDPSPVSSPQPSHAAVKTEVVDPEEKAIQGKSTVNILQELEKLVSLPRANVGEKAPVSQRRKELPVIDAFEIDTFFEALNPAEVEAKTSIKMEVQMRHAIKMELPEEQLPAENIPNFAALKDERSSPSVAYTTQRNVSSIMQSSPQPLVHSHIQSPVPQFYAPISPEAGQSFHCSDIPIISRDEHLDPFGFKKDMLVSSTMVSSPESFTSQETIDDILSLFSDDGIDMSAVQELEARSTEMMTPHKEDQMEAQSEKAYYDHMYMGKSLYNKPQPLCTQQMSEELSPQSSNSSLSGEDDLTVVSPTFSLSMALDVLDAENEVGVMQNSDIKDQYVLGLSDDLKLDFIFNSWGHPQGSLDMIKHGQ